MTKYDFSTYKVIRLKRARQRNKKAMCPSSTVDRRSNDYFGLVIQTLSGALSQKLNHNKVSSSPLIPWDSLYGKFVRLLISVVSAD